MNSSDRNNQFPNYYNGNSQIPQTKIMTNAADAQYSNTFISPTDEMDSRNEIYFAKSGTDPMFRDRKPLSNIQPQFKNNDVNQAMMTKRLVIALYEAAIT